MSKLERVGSILKRMYQVWDNDAELTANVLKTYRKYPDLTHQDFVYFYPADIAKVEVIHTGLISRGWL